jgi:hypothetical protein
MYFEDEKNQFPWAGALLVNLFKPFNSEQLNGFELITTELSAVFNDWPWEDLSGKKKYKAMHHALENYRRRVYFHPPYIGHYMTLSTEELATLYHIPSSTVSTPSLARIQSRTGEAPSNLPS